VARYKLIQDVEAEDHILGPLTLRQFIFALVSAFLLYIDFFLATKGLALFLIIFLPPTLFTVFFAIPFGRDQPTEIWALAKIRFLFLPRKRIWSQLGIKELVTINVPKKLEKIFTDGLSQDEVRSHLSALANTLDTRGWALKHSSLEERNNPGDRLVEFAAAPVEPGFDLDPDEDFLETSKGKVAQNFATLIDDVATERRQKLVDNLNSSSRAAEPTKQEWFEEEKTSGALPQVRNGASEAYDSNMRTLITSQKEAPAAETPEVTQVSDPGILNLAHNNDLNVSTLAREASKGSQGIAGNEVVVSLH
jgi:hypothetical protein